MTRCTGPLVPGPAALVFSGLLAVLPAQEPVPGGATGETDLWEQAAAAGLPVAWSVFLEPGAAFVAGPGLEDSPGEVDVWSQEIGVRLVGPVTPGSRVSTRLRYEHAVYDFDEAAGILPGTDDPFDSTHGLRLGGSWLQGLTPEWGVLLRGGVSAAAEVGADLEDGISWDAAVGVGHRFSESLTAGVGVALLRRLEDRLLVVPGIYVDWRPAEGWRLLVEGPGGELIYEPAEDWELALGLGFTSRSIRLDDGAPGFSGVFEDTRLPLYLRGAHRPGADLEVELQVGLDVYRELEVRDENGHELRELDVDPGVYLGLTATITL